MYRELMFLVCFGTILAPSSSSHTAQSKVQDALAIIMNNEIDREQCTNCNSEGPELPVTERDIKDIRIEFIKAQILKKLQLSERPNPVQMTKLPFPVTAFLPESRHESMERQKLMEESNAKTYEIVVLSTPYGTGNCELDDSPSICFGFKIPHDLMSEDISVAKLWIYKQRNILIDGDNELVRHTLVYYEIKLGSLIELKTQVTQIDEGWIQLDFTKILKRWISLGNRNPKVKVQCSSCGYRKPFIPISMEPGNQPLFAVKMEANHQKKRGKRYLKCHKGMTECCREELYISFKDVGWSDWIIRPPGYNAYFCTGSCNVASSASLASTIHSSLIRKMFFHTKRVDLIPCCAATEHSSLDLIYLVDNKTLTVRTLTDMVVEACGCT